MNSGVRTPDAAGRLDPVVQTPRVSHAGRVSHVSSYGMTEFKPYVWRSNDRSRVAMDGLVRVGLAIMTPKQPSC